MTAPGSIARDRAALLDTVAHEFFHGWNVERIRPPSREPFKLCHANLSSYLWLAEGFPEYIAPLAASGANLAVRTGRQAVDEGVSLLEERGVLVVERHRIRVRDRIVLRYYARTIQHLTPARGTTH